jgi:hypothetical protein
MENSIGVINGPTAKRAKLSGEIIEAEKAIARSMLTTAALTPQSGCSTRRQRPKRLGPA